MSKIVYPRQIEIRPLTNIPRVSVRVPGSKSITNRALVLASLTASSAHDTILDGALQSEDTEVMAESLCRLGYLVVPDWRACRVAIRKLPSTSIVPAASAELFVANSGTSMRFLTALVAL